MPVLAIVPDLYFATRIAATANTLGVELELVPAARAATRVAEPEVSLVILDLHQPEPAALIAGLKRAAPAVPIVGFFSHVDSVRQRDALAAGADAAIPRSQFVSRLPTLLQRGLAALPAKDLQR